MVPMRKTVPMRKIFSDRLRTQVKAALEARRSSSYLRAINGAPEYEFAVCLGPGRCMSPSQEGPKHCAFCVRYPCHRGSDDEAERIISTLRSGN